MREIIITLFLSRFYQETPTFFDGCSWFKYNNLGSALGMTLKFHTSVAKALKLEVGKIMELIPTFVKVKEKKLVSYVCKSYRKKLVGGGSFCLLS